MWIACGPTLGCVHSSLWALAVLVFVAQMACFSFSFVQAIWALTIIYRFVAFMTLKLKPVKPNLS